MNIVYNLIKRLFLPVQPLPTGNFQYQAPPESPKTLRLHLRIEPGGTGVLVINASTILHLNQTAAEYAYHFIKQTPPEQIGKLVANRYNIPINQAVNDYLSLSEKINALIETPDLDPVTFFDIDRTTLYNNVITAPYRLDCALTYRLSPGSPTDVVPEGRVTKECSLDEWKVILDKAFSAGIPHVVFTGGEPTLRDDLVDLIYYSEKLGFVTGLSTDGLRLANPDLFKDVLESGLDHITVLLDPENPICWQIVKNLVDADIALTVHLTITHSLVSGIDFIISKLGSLNVRHLSLSAADPDLKHDLLKAQNLGTEAGMHLVWDLPVPYSLFNPISAELEGLEEIPKGAGKAWLYIEPDGDVLPGQGVLNVIGNLLTDDWGQIWSNRPQS